MDIEEQTRIRGALLRASRNLGTAREKRDALIREGVAAGIPITELAALAKVSRQAVYNVLRRSGAAVHHIDGNPYNNDPANLTLVRIDDNTSRKETPDV